MSQTDQCASLMGLRATLLALALTMAGCASAETFALSSQELADAESQAQFLEGLALEADGIHGTFPSSQWLDGRCHWSDTPNVAVCAVQYRHYTRGPLLQARVRYEREENGGWRWLGPASDKTRPGAP